VRSGRPITALPPDPECLRPFLRAGRNSISAQRCGNFTSYSACLRNPWDGPALLVFSDGRSVGASVGSQTDCGPGPLLLTRDAWLVMVRNRCGAHRESGSLKKGRLGLGQMLAVDRENGRLLKNWPVQGRGGGPAIPMAPGSSEQRRSLQAQPWQDAKSWRTTICLQHQGRLRASRPGSRSG